MEKISDRIEGSVEEWRSKWGSPLQAFLAEFIRLGILAGMDTVGEKSGELLKPLVDKVERETEVPPELKPILDELKKPSGEAGAILGSAAMYSIVGNFISSFIDWFLRPVMLAFSYIPGFHYNPPELLIQLWLRGEIGDEGLSSTCHLLGMTDESIEQLKRVAHTRLDVASVQELWRRDPELYETLWKDIQDQGIDKARIVFLKELSKVIPPLADMVRFADFGAFDPEIIAKWRAFYDAPSWIREPMSLIGIEGKWADKYWFSHWRQPGRFELAEMHRRGLIDDEIVKMAYLTQGYSQFWQERLLDLVKEVPTRVDVRRFWDMRTIDEARLREIYHAQGYYGKDLDDYVLWTKVYVAWPDLYARWKNGWITLDNVKSELVALGMPADRVEEMIETKIKAAQPERTEKERELTKSEIVKGVKKEYITWDEGIDLLVDLGYDPTEAEFILAINVAVEAGSPETYQEFKDLTQKWRRSVGMEVKPMTEELKAAAAEVVRLTGEVEALNRSIEEEERGLVEEEVLPKETTAKLDELRVTLHRAEAELAVASSHYDSLLAEWRHKEA